MDEQYIRVKTVGRRASTAYISLPGHTQEPGSVKATVRLDSLIDYTGPMVVFDFNDDGQLIGIEVLVFGADDHEGVELDE